MSRAIVTFIGVLVAIPCNAYDWVVGGASQKVVEYVDFDSLRDHGG